MGKGSGSQRKKDVKLYRSMSNDEYLSIIANGNKFPYYDFAMEAKWFAVYLKDAEKWGDIFYPEGIYRIIEIIVPEDSLKLMLYNGFLDAIGPAYCAEIDLLNMVMKGLSLVK